MTKEQLERRIKEIEAEANEVARRVLQASPAYAEKVGAAHELKQLLQQTYPTLEVNKDA